MTIAEWVIARPPGCSLNTPYVLVTVSPEGILIRDFRTNSRGNDTELSLIQAVMLRDWLVANLGKVE